MKYVKTILIIGGIIIAAALLYLLLRPDTESAEKKEEISSISKEYDEYSRQIRELKTQLSEKEKELSGEETGWVILAFSAEDPDLMGTVLDTVKEAGLQATVVLDPQKLPGQEGASLSLQEAEILKEEGWDFALGGALKESASYKELFEKAGAYMDQQGLGTLQTFFFNGGDYQKGKEEVLQAMETVGFSLGAAFGSDESEQLSSMELEEYPSIYLCQNISMRKGLEISKRMISLAYNEAKPLILSDYSRKDTWEMDDETSVEELNRIIAVVKDMQSAQRINAGNATSFLEYYTNLNKEGSERQKEFEEFKKDCENQIAELEMKRRNLGME